MDDATMIDVTESGAIIARNNGLSGDQILPYEDIRRLCALARKGLSESKSGASESPRCALEGFPLCGKCGHRIECEGCDDLPPKPVHGFDEGRPGGDKSVRVTGHRADGGGIVIDSIEEMEPKPHSSAGSSES